MRTSVSDRNEILVRLFGGPLLTEVLRRLAHGEWSQGMREILAMQRCYPGGVVAFACWAWRRGLFKFREPSSNGEDAMKSLLPTPVHSWLRFWLKRYTTEPTIGWVRFGSLRRLTPISRTFGFDRGLPIDRIISSDFYPLMEAISGEMCWRLAMIPIPAGSAATV